MKELILGYMLGVGVLFILIAVYRLMFKKKDAPESEEKQRPEEEDTPEQ